MKDGLLKKVLLQMYQKIRKVKYRNEEIYTKIYIRHCRINPRKLVFENFGGKGYGDNPKYITEEILRQKLNWDLVWLTNEQENKFPQGVRVVKYGSLKAMRELASAKVWIDNIRNSERPPKKHGQVYLQTWHGGMGFKKVEKAVEASLNKNYILQAQKDGAETDAIISDCKLKSDIFLRDFWLKKDVKILETGQPRNDILFRTDKGEIRKKIKRYYGISNEAKIILYVPTFRDDLSIKGYDLDTQKVIECFQERFRIPFVFLMKFHPNVQIQEKCMEYNDKVINATKYPDIQELYLAADYLITDYSSTAFDFSIMCKPVFLYASDYKEYKRNRTMELKLEDTPFMLAETNNKLFENIMKFSFEEYQRKIEDFKENYWKPYDNGTASNQVVNWIKKECLTK